MVVKPEQQRVQTLLADTITLLCKNGLSYKSKFCISALIGITVDDDDVFLVDIRDTIKNIEDNSESSDNETAETSTSRKRRRKRRKSYEDYESEEDGASRLSGDEDNSAVSPSKRANIKQEIEDDDSGDLVFIKDEPVSADANSCSFNIASTESLNQQQHSDILGSMAQQGQLYATPTSDQQLPGSWDPGQGSGNFAQSSSAQGADMQQQIASSKASVDKQMKKKELPSPKKSDDEKRLQSSDIESIDNTVSHTGSGASKNTRKLVGQGKRAISEFMESKGRSMNELDSMVPEELDDMLCQILLTTRKRSGELVKLNTLKSLRYGLLTFLRTKGFLITDSIFVKSLQCFSDMKKELVNKGKGRTDHTEPITKEDRQKLYSPGNKAFNINTPIGLQNKVFFEILYHCRHGNQNIRQMQKKTFEIFTDSKGKRYVAQDVNTNQESDKNPYPEKRMYETFGSNCPVQSFEKYLSKLSSVSDLWQRPQIAVDEDEDKPWYFNVAMGTNTLSKIMCTISRMGKLSKIYTNASIKISSDTDTT